MCNKAAEGLRATNVRVPVTRGDLFCAWMYIYVAGKRGAKKCHDEEK